MHLWALSDLHIGHAPNRDTLRAIRPHPADWLIVAGDVGERPDHLEEAWDILCARFARVLWVPGNHELYTTPRELSGLRGAARYQHMVALCRARGVLTPEDPWPLWPGPGTTPTRIALLFLGYDYSFAPDGLSPEAARQWAAARGLQATDERYLHADPYPSREAWCAARVQAAEQQLSAVAPGERLVLVNHYPLRRDLVRLYRIPRFSIWCGTRATEDWHRRFPIDVVVSGHLHMRATDWRDGVRFEEVSLGYPRHWRPERGAEGYLRPILPHPPAPRCREDGPIWHR